MADVLIKGLRRPTMLFNRNERTRALALESIMFMLDGCKKRF